MSHSRPKPKLSDIAAVAGVSVATVSRVLSDHPAILPATKAHVRALAQELGYPLPDPASPRQKARARRPKKPGTICAVMPVALPSGSRLANAFEMDLLGGVGAAMRDHRLDFSVSAKAPYDNSSLTRFMEQHPYDGVIFFGQSQFHEGLNALADGPRPFVVWGVETQDQRYCSVGSDNFACGHRATQHLVSLGRKRIAFVGQSAPITTAQTSQSQLSERLAGFRSALAAAGLPTDITAMRPAGSGLEAGEQGLRALLDKGIAFDAVVASSDLVALGAIRVLRSEGLRVPEDVAVVGYDDSAFARLMQPQLTTMRQDPILAGHLLVTKLLRAMAGYEVKSERLPTELVIRESCGSHRDLPAIHKAKPMIAT
ncbi:LacI family DNA-binding transcriptional regulator [Novosphingobium cyanobacteriorum]|uniref:LacI family DNA-binding transcriptional regulator n=1 Tax=Novosphingobium cyanobacteriorum TaxID=3024215 RepID=A0ABT6CDW4_9SPHN|nr:LacI family DNA-binding transcriptional regulator [Novosphingobium cyanobacteriorum]MDF8331996.1 LacI family DNA-binding transcriptional regulator [Novosphingobium cyanobacteriorum]